MKKLQETNSNTATDIFNKMRTKNVRQMQKILKPDEEKNKKEKIEAVEALFDYVEKHVYRNTPEERQTLDTLIRRIYELEMRDIEEAFMEDMGEIPLYIGDEAGDLKPSIAGQYEYGKCIKINTNESYKRLASTDTKYRMEACKAIIHTMFHEIQHHKQYILATSKINTKEGMEFAKEFAVLDIMSRKYYHEIYNQSIIENNAEKEAEKMVMERIGNTNEEEQKMLFHILNQNFAPYEVDNIETSDGRRSYDMIKQGKKNIMNQILNDAIVKDGRLDLLEKYKMLKKKYNPGGEKRSVKELIKKMKEESNNYINNTYLTSEEVESGIENIEDVYLDLIYEQLEETTPEELKDINRDDLQEVLNKMEIKFEKEAQEMLAVQERNIQLSGKLQPKLKPWQLIKKIQRYQQENGPKTYIKQRLKEQKKFIKGVKKGRIPIKMSKLETQALQTIRPFERKMTIVGNTIMSKMIKMVNGVAIRLKKIFKQKEKPFNLEDRRVEIPEEYKKKMKENIFKEKLKVQEEELLSNKKIIKRNKEKQQTKEQNEKKR